MLVDQNLEHFHSFQDMSTAVLVKAIGGTVGPQLVIAKKKILEFLFENLWVESQDSRAFSALN